jgi:beta-lactamase superfamily II metal-dependent hydrolase
MSREFYTSYATDRNADTLRIFDTVSGKIEETNAGDVISVDEINIRVIATPDVAMTDQITLGESGVVYRIETENKKILAMGESGEKGGAAVLNADIDPKSDILMIVNYGGRGISEEFFRRVSASECIFSVCIRDLYGEYGEGLYTRNTGIIRTRELLISSGTPSSKQYINTFGCVTVEL